MIPIVMHLLIESIRQSEINMLNDKRLITIAHMIRRGDRVADVGADHAYLSLYLIKEQIASSVIASDIGDGPLKNAAQNLKRNGNTQSIILRKSDGLKNYSENEVDSVIIAGMGGDSIIKIISETEWLKNRNIDLILQPMTSAEDLRKYLSINGFAITDERAVISNGRVYTIIKSSYCGRVGPLDKFFLLTGCLNCESDPFAAVYIRRIRNITQEKMVSICRVRSEQQEYRELKETLIKIDKVLEHYGD